MEKKWVAIGNNGIRYEEGKDEWSKIRHDIQEISLVIGEQTISLPKGMDEYNQAKTARAVIGSNKVTIESRYISCSLGNNIMRIRVNESTSNITLEVESVKK